MFLHIQSTNEINYYSLRESYREPGENNPRQRVVLNLGRYDNAVTAIEAANIPETKKQRFVHKMAVLEGRFDQFPIAPQSYQVIVCDAPWHKQSLEQILEMPIPELSDRAGCVLWLWASNDFIVSALQCLEHWGYGLKSILTWDWESPKAGKWLKPCTEHCLLAVRGDVKPFKQSYPTILRAPRPRQGKPEDFYQLVEVLSPDNAKLEIFGKKQRPGWDFSR